MKKFYTISIFVLVLLLVTGCSTGGYPLTQEESDAIAQYSAHLLLKYSKNVEYNDKLLDKKEYEEAIVTPEPTATPTPKPTATPTQKPTEETSSDDVTDTPKPEQKPTEEPAKPTEVVEADKELKNLSQIFGKSFDVEYVEHFIGEVFTENAFLSLSAPSGKNLCIVTLNIKNKSDSTKRIKADDLNVTYMLLDSGKLVDTAELSLLANDIQFLDDDIKAGGSMKTMILFYVSNTDGDFTLRFRKNDSGKYYDLKLK